MSHLACEKQRGRRPGRASCAIVWGLFVSHGERTTSILKKPKAPSCYRFVGATEGGRKRQFLFRRDPRDISTVSFWDPDLLRYAAIPYRNTTHPPTSVGELRELRRKLQEIGSAPG
jgi:hypothetical protein